MKKIILILIFVLVAIVVSAQERGDVRVSVIVLKDAIYKLTGTVFPDGENIGEEYVIKSFTVLSEENEDFSVDMEGGKYIVIEVKILDGELSGAIQVNIYNYENTGSMAWSTYHFTTGLLLDSE